MRLSTNADIDTCVNNLSFRVIIEIMHLGNNIPEGLLFDYCE